LLLVLYGELIIGEEVLMNVLLMLLCYAYVLLVITWNLIWWYWNFNVAYSHYIGRVENRKNREYFVSENRKKTLYKNEEIRRRLNPKLSSWRVKKEGERKKES